MSTADTQTPEQNEATDHDRLFKELIQTFFKDFMQLFFPELYDAIDFKHITFLSEEVFTDVTAGEKRRVDLLIQTRLKGEKCLIIIHIETQSYRQPEFNKRMFIYFSRLFEKYDRRILPIAVFHHKRIIEEPDEFRIEFPFLNVLHFKFHKLELHKKNWRDYLKQDNPVAAALLSNMGFKAKERVEVKKEFLRMLTRLELDPARMTLIIGFFESYLRWNDKNEAQAGQGTAQTEPRGGGTHYGDKDVLGA